MIISNNNSPIGVFDSGVGGLTVLSALAALLPHEKFIYVGDTARVPYGTKSAESVQRFSLEIAGFFQQKNVKMVVVACNTASAVALGKLRQFLSVPVLGVIEPGAHAAVQSTHSQRIGIIGTQATVRSQAYERAIHRLSPGAKVFSRVCSLFVPLAEEGWLDHKVTHDVADIYLSPLLKNKIDTLVLGCTHYPLLKQTVQTAAGRVNLIDSAEETAKAVQARLKLENHLSRAQKGKSSFYSSDDPAKFAELGRQFFKGRLPKVQRIALGAS